MQLANTLWVGRVTMFLTLVIGLAVAFLPGRTDLKWRGLA